jgi:hypothetical protein
LYDILKETTVALGAAVAETSIGPYDPELDYIPKNGVPCIAEIRRTQDKTRTTSTEREDVNNVSMSRQ